MKRKGFARLPFQWATLLRHGLKRSASAPHRTAANASLPPELAPDSPLMAACTTLYAGLTADQTAAPPWPLALVSTSVTPGCTLTAAGLALVLANEGHQTLLVDANLRAPRLHQLLGLNAAPGFADLLTAYKREQHQDSWGVPQEITDMLHVLPAGVSQDPISTLLRPAALQPALAALCAQYEVVIVTIADQSPHPDALLVVAALGTAMVVVASGSVSPAELRQLRVRLDRASVRLLGFSYVEEE